LELDLNDNKPKQSDCFLILTDNTSAMGWLRKTNFNDSKEKSAQLQIARHLARLLITNKICLFSQYLEGEKNEVADMLSREHEMSDEAITNKIVSNFPTQVPTNTFKVTQLPQELTSQFLHKVQEWQLETAQQKEHNNDTQVTGNDGLSLQQEQTSILTLTDSNNTEKLNCYQHSCTLSGSNNSTPFELLASWHQKHAVSMLPAWQRPIYSAAEETQDSIWTETYQDFYLNK
jgi:hypothetical protein